MNLSLIQLRVLVMVARLGNFTRAAERLNLSQPSLSLHVRQLEAVLGVRLFDRTTRSVGLTSAGEEFVPVAERLLDELQTAAGAMADLAARRRGRVAVAVLPSIAAELLPRAIAALHARHPGITVSLRDDVAERIAARVRGGEVDFGLGAIGGLDADVFGSPLISDELIAVFPRAHPLAKAARVTWRMLARYPFVAMSRDSSVRRLSERAFAHNGLVLEPAFEATYMSTALGIIAQGLAVGALPSSAASMVRQADLRHAQIRGPAMKRQVGIIRRRGRSLSPAAEALVACLKLAAAPANGARIAGPR